MSSMQYYNSIVGSQVKVSGDNVGIGTSNPTGTLDVSGIIIATSGNSTQWNTAYGWGDHSTSGYLTAHPNISGASSSNNSGQVFIQDVLLDTNGHVTGLATATASGGGADTNTFVTGASFSDTNGVSEITLSLNSGSDITVNMNTVPVVETGSIGEPFHPGTGLGHIDRASYIPVIYQSAFGSVNSYPPVLRQSDIYQRGDGGQDLISINPLEKDIDFELGGVNYGLFATEAHSNSVVIGQGSSSSAAGINSSYGYDISLIRTTYVFSGHLGQLSVGGGMGSGPNYTFPISDGSAGQSLVTDGAGNLVFSGVTAGTTYTAGTGLALDGGTEFNVSGIDTSLLVGTITNAQLAGSIANAKLSNSSVNYGGISLALGGSDLTPAFNLVDATGYPTSSLVGTISNAQLAGSIANAKLSNSAVTINAGTGLTNGGVVSLGGSVDIDIDNTVLTTGSSLGDLSNVDFSSGPATNEVLRYSNATSKWINGSIDISIISRGSLPMGGHSSTQMGHYFYFDSSAGEAVINTDGDDVNFRVEGTGNNHLFFVDAGTERVGINNSAPSHTLDISGMARVVHSNGLCGLQIEDGGGSGVHIGDCAYSVGNTYAGMKHSSHTNSSEYMIISRGDHTYLSAKEDYGVIIRGGNNNSKCEIRVYDADVDGQNAVVINEGAYDRDVRIEGTGDQNLFKVDASADSIGIGTSTPSQKLDVRGDILVSSKLLVGSGVYSATSPGAYFGLKHTGLAGSAEYMIMSAGTHTYLSAKEDSNVYIRGGGNKTDHQIMVSESGITIGKYRPAASSVVAEHDVELVYDDGTCVRIADRGGSGVMIGDCALSGNATYAGIKHTNMMGTQDYMIVSQGGGTFISAANGESVFIRAGGNNAASEIRVNAVASGGVGIVFNEAAQDRDIRMEGTGDPNVFRLDASVNSIGIGTPTPAYKLDVSGTFSADSVNVNNQYTLPTTDGSAGQSLVTDGAGNIVFSGVTGGSGGSGNLVRGSEAVTVTTGLFDVSGGYNVGTLDVYQNGIKLFEGASYDYTATDGLSFSLNNLATSGDLIEYIGLNTSTNAVGDTSLGTITVTSSQDVFNTSDTFTSASLAVFLNGVKLVAGIAPGDYQVTSPSQFTLNSPAASGDVVEYIAYGATVASSNLQKTGDTMTGNLTVNADLIVRGYKETHTDNGNTGTSQTIDISSSTLQTYTLTGNCTFTMPTPEAGRSFTMFLKTGAGSFTATFTGVKFPLNTAPTITTDANRMDLITFYCDGTNWYGNVQQEYHV